MRLALLILALLAACATPGPSTAVEHPADRPGSESVALEKGRTLLETGLAAKARPVLEQAALENPRSPEARLLLGTCLSKLGEGEKAVGVLGSMLELDPRPAQLAKAVRVVQRLRDPFAGLSPEIAADARKALDRAGAGDAAAALTALESLAARAPDEPLVEELLGLARERSGDERGATLALRRAIEQGPRRPQGRRYLADLYHDRGEHGLAEALYAEVVERDPFDDAARSRLAAYALAHGDAASAIVQLRAVSALAPGDPLVRLRLARARLRVGDTAGAEADLTRATEMEDPGPDPFRELGQLLLGRRAGARGEARDDLGRRAAQAFQKALSLRPGDADAVRGLAEARSP